MSDDQPGIKHRIARETISSRALAMRAWELVALAVLIVLTLIKLRAGA